MNPWLTFSLYFLVIWAVIFATKPTVRKQMLWVSIITTPLGFLQALVIPEYWHPPSLFNLNTTIGFDIESLIFGFAVGGISAILYELVVRAEHTPLTAPPQQATHIIALATPLILLAVLFFHAEWNGVYAMSAAALAGAWLRIQYRPDLTKKTLIGGILFLALYTVSFILLTRIYPNFVETTWNLPALSGILALGIPLEELIFALAQGLFWSGIYEQITHRTLRVHSHIRTNS